MFSANNQHSYPNACQLTICPALNIYQLMKPLSRSGGSIWAHFSDVEMEAQRGKKSTHRVGKQIWNLLSPELACWLVICKFVYLLAFIMKIFALFAKHLSCIPPPFFFNFEKFQTYSKIKRTVYWTQVCFTQIHQILSCLLSLRRETHTFFSAPFLIKL